MIVCLDFDGTLHDTSTVPKGKRLGRPVAGAVAACFEMVRAGNKLVVHTARAGHSEDLTWLRQWLDYWGFPNELFMAVSYGKPQADLYVDDKAHRFNDWDIVLDVVVHGYPPNTFGG